MNTAFTPAGQDASNRQFTGWKWLLVTAALVGLILWPLLALQSRAFLDGFADFHRVASFPGIWQTLWNTILLALGSVVVALVLGTGLAWATTKLPKPLKAWLSIIPILPLTLPAIANVIGWVFLLSPRVGYINAALRRTGLFGDISRGPLDVFSMPGIILITGFSLTSFVYLFVHASLRQRGTALEAAAAASGASPLRTFFTITLPLLRPALVYATAVSLLLGLGQFTAPLILGRSRGIDVLTTEMFRVSEGFPIDYAAGAVLGTPLLLIGVLVIMAQRRALKHSSRYTVVAGKTQYAASQTSWWAAVPVIGYAVIAVGLPLGAIMLVSLVPFWSGDIDFAAMSFENFSVVLQDPRLTGAITTSTGAAAVTVLIAIPLGLVVARALTNRSTMPNWNRQAIDVLSTLPLTMPAALFGFAILFSYAGPPTNLYGSATLFVIAYVILMLPHAVRPQLSAMIATGEEYLEAARVSGAGTIRTFVEIVLPLIRSGVGASIAIVVILVFHEFAASAMVRSARTQVMGTLLYEYYVTGTYPRVAVVALVMFVITAIGVGIALSLGGSKALER